jgi:CRP/FNR family cyclic AMP-dependent transcriptional regulator
MKELSYKKNSTVMTQGDKTRSLFIISEGRMKVFANDEDGGQTIFTFQGKGKFFGELSLLDDAPRSASVVAVEDSKVLTLSHQHFDNFLSKHPEICPALFKALTTRIRQMDDTICTLTSRDIYGRLVQTLYNEATEQSDGTFITQRLTHQDLAEMVGSSREMVSRIFKELKVGGYIEVEKKQVIIKKQLPSRW